MSLLATFVVLAFSLVSLSGCQDLSEGDLPRIKSEIESSANQASLALEEFPKSLSSSTILKHYAADYSGVKDGIRLTLKDQEKSLNDLAEQIKLGDSIGISHSIKELTIQTLTKSLAWITYQDETKLGRGGALLSDMKARCTALVRKEGEAWLIFHEHCSSIDN